MADYISVTNSFSSGAVAASGDVNQNFTDIVNGLQGGTKDLHVRDISMTSATVTGNVSVGRDTFESWSGGNAIQLNKSGFWLGDSSDPYSYFGNNAYYDGSWKYLESDCKPFRYLFQNNGMTFSRAASGTADNAITWVEVFHNYGSGMVFNEGANSDEDFRIETSNHSNGFFLDSSADKMYSDIFKTTSTTAVSMAYVCVNLSTGELFSKSAAI